MIDSSDYSLESNTNQPETQAFSRMKWYSFWRSLIYLMLVSLGGGISYSWYFLTQEMIPMIEKPVSKFLSRPIKLGEIQAISFTSIRLGESYLPTTNQENDYVIAKEVEIALNPLKLLSKKVELNIDIYQAKGYLKQDENNLWLKLKLNKRKPQAGGWRFAVNEIAVQDSNLNLKNKRQPQSSSLTKVNIPSAHITFNNPHQYEFNLQGNLENGGKVIGNGSYKPQEKQWLLTLNNQDLPIDTVNQIVNLPVNLDSGKVNGNLTVGFRQNKLDLGSLDGEMKFSGVNLSIPKLPQTLSNSKGKIAFQNRNIILQEVNTNFGLINAQAQGEIINYKQLDITANTNKSINIDDVLTSLKLDKVNLERQGKVRGKLKITGNIKQPLVKADVVNDGNIKIEKIPINKLSADLAIHNSQLNLDKLEVLPSIGGKIKATGRVSLNRQDSDFNIDWEGENIAAEKLASLYQQRLPIKVGMVNGKYTLTGNWQQIDQTKLTGISTVELSSGKATINQLEINQQTWQGEVKLSSFKLADLATIDCQKIGCQESILNGQFRVSGKRDSINLNNINLAGRFNFDLAQGKVTLENTRVNGNNWQALVKVNNLDVSQLPSINLSSSPIKENIKVTAELQARGNLSEIRDIDLQGKGSINLPQGKIQVSNFTLKKDDFVATATANSFPLGDWNQSLRGDATGKLRLAGNLNYLQPQAIEVNGNLKLSEGISLVKQPLDVAFRWNGHNLEVKEAIIDAGIKAKGIINYDLDSNTVKDIDLNLTAKQVDIKELPLPKSLALINYQGKINFQGKITGEIASAQLQGEVSLNNLQLAHLPFATLTGNLIASPAQGVNLDLNSDHEQDKLFLKLDENYQPQEIYLQTQNTKIQGKTNKQNLAVNVVNIPLNKVTQPWLSYFPPSVKQIDGNLSGDIDLDLNSYNLTKANIVVNQPRLNHLEGDILTTELTSVNGTVSITKGSLQHLGNRYDFTGQLQPLRENPQLQANVKVAKGNIQSLLTSLQFFDFGDIPKGFQPRKYSTAKDLYTSVNENPLEDSVNGESDSLPIPKDNLSSSTLPATKKPLASIQGKGESLSDNLAFFETIEKQLQTNNQQRMNTTLPELEQLDGNFSGSINLTASVATGVKAEFDFQGDYWQWGKYEGDLLQLTGSYDDGLLTFLPVKIQSNESILSLTGTFQPERISGEVTLSNFPVSQLKPFLNIPETFDIEGNINATVAISGSEEQPLAKGNIEVVDSRINGNKIETTQASFGFRNSRIDFLASSSLNEETDYFTIIASIPFQLFPNSNQPESNNFNVEFYLLKEGFSLLSVLTDNQLNWVKGDGNIDLKIEGKYNQARNEVTNIQTEGIANLSDGVIKGKVLDEGAITNINGQVLFDFAQINIPDLKGDFSGGQIALSGSLPLVDEAVKGQSLNISVDDLALNLENLYQGNAHGDLAITGSAIAPKIGGKIELENGNIKIVKKENNQTKRLAKNGSLSQVKLDNLSLKLGDNLHITQPVLLKLRAEGKLNVNGDLNNLSPDGVVKLKSGTVNLFTSQLKLAENHDNVARFTPQNGFKPYLNLQLESSVTETSRYQLPDNSNPNEIQDLSNFSINTAQTIKVKANVKGRSDNLMNNIELSSSPSRNQTEIIALLGGGFVDNFAAGNSELNLVNFASAAVLGGVQGEIHKALGIDELRLFPAQIIDPEKRTSTFGLGAELALDLTDTFSVSVTKILTNEQVPRYSVRYRLNEQTILRGSSDFEQDTRGVIEFQKRF